MLDHALNVQISSIDDTNIIRKKKKIKELLDVAIHHITKHSSAVEAVKKEAEDLESQLKITEVMSFENS